jgi:hypothetical protein
VRRKDGVVLPRFAGASQNTAPRSVAFDASGKRLAIGVSRREVDVFDVETARHLFSLSATSAHEEGAFLSPVADVVYAGGVMRDTATGAVLWTAPFATSAGGVRFAEDGDTVWIRTGDVSHVVDAKSGRLLATADGEVSLVSRARGLTVVRAGHTARFFSWKSGKQVLDVTAVAEAAALARAPSGRVELLGADAAEAQSRMRCVVGTVVLPFEVCEERFAAAGMFDRMLRGEDADAP